MRIDDVTRTDQKVTPPNTRYEQKALLSPCIPIHNQLSPSLSLCPLIIRLLIRGPQRGLDMPKVHSYEGLH